MKTWAVLAGGAVAALAALTAVLTLGAGSGTDSRQGPAGAPAQARSEPTAKGEPGREGDISDASRNELRKWMRETQ